MKQRLDTLIHQMLDSRLQEEERIELNQLLRSSKSARDHYRGAIALHGALIRKCDPSQAEFPLARPSEVSRVSENPRNLIPFKIYVGAAAAVALVVSIFIYKNQPQAVINAGNFRVSQGSPELSIGKIPVGVPLDIRNGSLTLGFPSGAEVFLEAPCRFQLDRKEALTVSHGRVSVHAPDGAEGFQLDTPGGKFTDLGTRFGVAVGSDGSNAVVLTEVFEGAIDIETPHNESIRLVNGQSRAILHDGSSSKIVSDLDSSPIHLSRSTAADPVDQENLAFGKPVFSPGYCVRSNGSVFPPDNLTDGRLNDSGVPGDWSFWLAPDGENGEFTVDLLQEELISRVSLQNSGNRFINDRGIEKFAMLISTDNQNFTPVIEGELDRIDPGKPGKSFPFHTFTFPAASARYVKIIVLSHYRHPDYPVHGEHSGGLNEIRIFR